jgi:hypothetical protein
MRSIPRFFAVLKPFSGEKVQKMLENTKLDVQKLDDTAENDHL